MTAFLKIDRCSVCNKDWPWEWVPPLQLGGRPLAGTGVWRSALVNGLCASCADTRQGQQQEALRGEKRREELIRIVGIRPAREFKFDRYQITPVNRNGFEWANRFDASRDNMYLWGPCGVGKTHLAAAVVRRHLARGASIVWMTPCQLVRKLRMKSPDEEQSVLDALIRADVLVLDDLGVGGDTPFARQMLQEILDGRNFNDQNGLIITSQHTPAFLTRRWNDRAISSRLAGMCQVIEIQGPDRRLIRPGTGDGRRTKDCVTSTEPPIS